MADVVCMTRLGDRIDALVGRVAKFSPDGKKFVVVLRKGNLKQNTNEFSLLLWNTGEIVRDITPDVMLTMSSSSNREAIQRISWLADNETITFLGEHPGELRQLYAFNVRTRTLKKVSNHPTNLIDYDITPTGDRVAYTAEAPTESLSDAETQRKGMHITWQWLPTLMANEKVRIDQLFVESVSGSPGKAERLLSDSWVAGRPFVSPDGKYVVIAEYELEKNIRASWRQYQDSFLIELLTSKYRHEFEKNPNTSVRQYMVIDTATKIAHSLINTPISGSQSEIVWLSDSRSIVTSGTFLPLDGIRDDERKVRQSARFAVEVDVSSGEITKISQDDLKLVRWDKDTARLVFEPGKAGSKAIQLTPKIYFRKNGEHWEKATDSALDELRPEVILEEDMNSPPKIVAVSARTQEKSLLLDLNPRFTDLKFGRVEEVVWKNSSGSETKGGLYYPANYTPGKRYPLVIQTHGWDTKRFWIDGPFPTAFAAQGLAGKGIMVLQVDGDWSPAIWNTPREAEVNAHIYEEAIDHLDQIGLIDRNRVGILGFSRTCLHVKFALTHSAYHFAAASVTDGVSGDYFSYVSFSNNNKDLANFYEGVNGGAPPFGKGLHEWIERSPSFAIEKVQTPVLITAVNPTALLGEWEWFAAMHRLEKPVDLIYIPEGTHLLERPWDRIISQQGNEDWFCFWLTGEEDTDPTKGGLYARWRDLRALEQH